MQSSGTKYARKGGWSWEKLDYEGCSFDPRLWANGNEWEGQTSVPLHGRFEPRNRREKEPKFENPMVSYEGPIMRSTAKFINLVTHLDSKKAYKGDWKFSE